MERSLLYCSAHGCLIAYSLVLSMEWEKWCVAQMPTCEEGGTENAESFLSKTTATNSKGEEINYFGGQEYNQVLVQAANHVFSGYQFL